MLDISTASNDPFRMVDISDRYVKPPTSDSTRNMGLVLFKSEQWDFESRKGTKLDLAKQ